MKWLTLHYPNLPLELHTRATGEPGPLALWSSGRERRILMCNQQAEQRGVMPGQAAAAALALAGDVRLLPHKPEAEQAALERIAAWAYRFSSHVALAPPRALLLEAGRSLLLFRGAEGLMDSVLAESEKLGYRAHWCLAPTPEASLLLAGLGMDVALSDETEMRSMLQRVPISSLPIEPRDLQTLADMGLRTLGELLRLPQGGLAQRFGIPLVDYLNRLLGRSLDLRPVFNPPDRFRSRLELPSEVSSTQALLFAARRLVAELCGFLIGRGAGVQHMEWVFFHAEEGCSRLELGLARPGRDPLRMLELLRERLDRFELPEPVREIGLRADDISALSSENLELLPDADRSRMDAGEQLLERLRARLGREAVTGLSTVADYRPERAWRYVPAGEGRGIDGNRRRPLWLLPKPEPLEQSRGLPRYRGKRLLLEPERERIETGWWDGQSVARDYFIARHPEGGRMWLYREVSGEGRWFLQGWFA